MLAASIQGRRDMLRMDAIVGAIVVVLGCLLCTGTASAADDGCARAGAVVGEDVTPTRASVSVLCLVNNERRRRGLRGVRASRPLTRSAKAHSVDMVRRRYFAHVAPSGGTVRDRVLRSGYVRKRQPSKVGETIAWGTDYLATPAQLVRSFMQSPGHRQVLLDRAYRDVGVGLVRGAPAPAPGAGATLTLDFGHR
jgi:uncharacterized protein YkwD